LLDATVTSSGANQKDFIVQNNKSIPPCVKIAMFFGVLIVILYAIDAIDLASFDTFSLGIKSNSFDFILEGER